MKIPILIEVTEDHRFRATGGEPFAAPVEADTPEAALDKMKRGVLNRMAQGGRIAALDLPGGSNPWLQVFGMFQDDPALRRVAAGNPRQSTYRQRYRRRSLTAYHRWREAGRPASHRRRPRHSVRRCGHRSDRAGSGSDPLELTDRGATRCLVDSRTLPAYSDPIGVASGRTAAGLYGYNQKHPRHTPKEPLATGSPTERSRRLAIVGPPSSNIDRRH